ncbi:hypothetical protein ElyMa_005606200 [Elysia marginata]|uniref:Uncharacterized protein n=1 Tax=Elysia marginata TaxID=1093978 RepID=A0AAV4F5S0_9GAST|nr:hypothetical protein ElyMa_005606200 [Elysia marginata]
MCNRKGLPLAMKRKLKTRGDVLQLQKGTLWQQLTTTSVLNVSPFYLATKLLECLTAVGRESWRTTISLWERWTISISTCHTTLSADQGRNGGGTCSGPLLVLRFIMPLSPGATRAKIMTFASRMIT